jgi:hypothetical protein
MPSAKSSVICIASINNQNDYRKPLFNELMSRREAFHSLWADYLSLSTERGNDLQWSKEEFSLVGSALVPLKTSDT